MSAAVGSSGGGRAKHGSSAGSNSGKAANTQGSNEPRKMTHGKRDSKTTGDGRLHAQKNENVWSARTNQSPKQAPRMEQSLADDLSQKFSSELVVSEERVETNHEQRQHKRQPRSVGSGNHKSSPGQRGPKRTSPHDSNNERGTTNTQKTLAVAHKDSHQQGQQAQDGRHSQDQEEQDGPERSSSPNTAARAKAKVKLSLAEFISTVGGSEDSEEEVPSRVLWVGNIGPEVTDEELTQEFVQYGKLESLRILHDRFCAFVNFEDEECAKKAKAGLNGTILGSQYIVINYRKADSKPPSSGSGSGGAPVNSENSFILNTPSRALWIGNISDEVTEEDLFYEFSQFGDIESVRLLTHKTCAFVNFLSVEDATNALHNLQGRELGNMPIKINFGKPPKRMHDMYGQYMPGPYMPQPYYQEYQYPFAPGPYMPPMAPFVPMEPQYPLYMPTNICEMCGVNLKETAFTPCGHSFCCNECIPKFRAGSPDKGTKCPYCVAGIEKVVQVSYQAYNAYAGYPPVQLQEYPQQQQ